MANSVKKEAKSRKSTRQEPGKGKADSTDSNLIADSLEEHLEKTLSFDLDSVFERELKNIDFS